MARKRKISHKQKPVSHLRSFIASFDKTMLIISAVIILLIVFVIVVFAIPKHAKNVEVEEAAAIGRYHGTEILVSKQELALWESQATQRGLNVTREYLLTQYLQYKILLARGKELNIIPNESAIDLQAGFQLSLLKQQYDQTQIDARLAMMNTTYDEYVADMKKTIRESMIIKEVFDRDVVSTINVSDSELMAEYNLNKELYSEPKSASVRHILVCYEGSLRCKENRTESEAKTIVTHVLSLVNSTSFEKLAENYSDDSSASLGGDLGILHEGDTVPEFETAVFSLKAGEISGPVKTDFGFHIIQVYNVTSQRDSSFEDVRDYVYDSVVQKKAISMQKEYLDGLLKEANVEYK